MDKEQCPYTVGQKIENNSYTILSIKEGNGFWDLCVEHIETGKKETFTAFKPSAKKNILGIARLIQNSLPHKDFHG